MLPLRLRWLVVSLAWIPALGCQQNVGGSASASAGASAALQASSVAPRASGQRFRPTYTHHGGIASSLFRAAHDLDLSQAQRQSLDELEATLGADDEVIRAAMRAFRSDLIAGVKPGALDKAKLTADDALVDKAIADHQSKEAQALDALHGLLDGPQRETLVASIRAKKAEREIRMTEWMRGKAADGGSLDWSKRRLEKLTADLALEPDQQKRVAAMIAAARDLPNPLAMQARWDDRKKRGDALLTAFASDAFDAKTLDLTVLPGKTAHEPLDHMVTFFAQILPILYANQRDKLAESLDRPFGAGRFGAPGIAPARGPADDITFPFAEPVESPNDEVPAPAR